MNANLLIKDLTLVSPAAINNINSENYIRRVALMASIALFVCSLTQKCYCTTNQCGDSIMAVLVGWTGLFFGGAALTWLANPVMWVSWFFLKTNSRLSFMCSIISSVTCLSFLLFDTIIDDEAGHYNKIVKYKVGYWLWLTSALVMLIGNLILYVHYKNDKAPR